MNNALRLLTTLAALLALAGCSAYPARGPRAVRIDPAFTAEQRSAIYDAVNAWDVQAGLTVAVSSWDDSSAVPIVRDDELASSKGELGLTHVESAERARDLIRIAGAGTFPNGLSVSQFDFETTAAHELGHLLGLTTGGCDGEGHSADATDLMYAHGTPDGARHEITAHDVDRVLAAVDRAWP